MKFASFPLLILLVSGFYWSSVAGQTTANSLFQSRHSATIAAGFAFRSDCITHEFANAYFRHAFIDESLKDRVGTRLNRRNAFAVEFGTRVDYYHRLSTDSSRLQAWSIQLENRDWIHSDFSGDVFELYFRGNRTYKGKTADLSDFRFTDLHWQTLKASLHVRLSHTDALSIGAGVVRGLDFLDIRTGRGSLYTAPNGYYLDADLDLTIRQQDSSSTGFRSWNGTGAVLDLGWKRILKDGSTLEIIVNDLGFVAFNKKSSLVPSDSTFRFEGIDATELFNFSDTLRGSIRSDSAFVQGFLTSRKKESYEVLLPALLRARYSRQWLDGRYGCTIELQQRLFYRARPLASLEGTWRLNNHHQLHLYMQYGEYAPWMAGLGYSLTAGQWQLQASSRFLSAWMSAGGRSAGAFLTLTKFFRP